MTLSNNQIEDRPSRDSGWEIVRWLPGLPSLFMASTPRTFGRNAPNGMLREWTRR